ncbi:MAG: glycosyltransferase family 2 protein [Oscillospiraceae bacterium]|nr:glycosyltransferase family 2 protein [Oscillospiraceae bacterium]
MNKKKKRNSKPPQALVRLSQCMIVKNEEKNIEKALSWARGIAFEQIVVDTGSTDKTVEIAENMGARVYHFEWINDFSAAKNFAIEKASGNWIALLDADEYLSEKDAKTLMTILKKIRADQDMREKCLVLNVPLVNVDEKGNPMSVYDQERFFRNIKAARYKGKIHEMIDMPPEHVFRVDEITVIHTGYAKSVYDETGKAGRNIGMLRAELLERPDDLNLKAFLADALKVRGQQGDSLEADRLYLDVVNGIGVYEQLKKGAYKHLIEKCLNMPDRLSDAEVLSLKALADFPEDIDLGYFYGEVLNRKGEFLAAQSRLQECERRLINAVSLDVATMIMAKPILLFHQLAVAAQGLGDLPGLVRYATMALLADKTQSGVLSPYIGALLKRDTSEDEVKLLLSKIYDMDNPKDLIIIARAAKDCGALDFARKILVEIEDKCKA